MMVYQWKSARQIKADPNEAAKVMNQLAENGTLTAENLVEISRPISAPLHNDFEWDDTKAAIKFREHQARNIISALVIVPDEQIPAKEPVRAYFKVEPNQHVYSQLETIISTPSKKDMLLKNALHELSVFEKKYSVLKELSEVFESIDNAMIVYG